MNPSSYFFHRMSDLIAFKAQAVQIRQCLSLDRFLAEVYRVSCRGLNAA